MKSTPFIWMLSALLLLAGGCSKNSIIIETGGQGSGAGSGPDGSGQTDAGCLVGFHATVESLNLTRSMSPISTDTKATIYAYIGSASDASQDPIARGSYLSQQSGTLTGIGGYKMQLNNGVFDFYGVSLNSDVLPPSFRGGKSGPLQNGVDYLWWGTADYDINAAQVTVPIVFGHSATQVVFELEAGTGIVLHKIASATITASQPGAAMDLATGVIPPAAGYAAQKAAMGINGMRIQYTMLPLKTDTPMTLSLSLNVNFDATPHVYTVQVPLPDGELKAGNSYLFKAVIDANDVTFPSVSVTDWVRVDETGNPLYPY